MSTAFTLQFLQEQIGEQYVEENLLTGKPRIIQGLNEVWAKLEEHGGVGQVARLFGLSESDVWAWVDLHCIPDLYVPYLVGDGQRISDVQLCSVGYEDPVSGESWPRTWGLDTTSFNLQNKLVARS